ncbi:MAG: ABC transporter ATP-binding protein [Lysobacteraceae bacterium]
MSSTRAAEFADLLEVRGLRTEIATAAGRVFPVDGVDLSVGAGQAVALVGESGSGKSMTALSIMRLLRPPVRIESGSVRFKGQELTRLSSGALRRIRGAKIAMVFQDPMTFLNPLRTVGSQVGEMVELHKGFTRQQAKHEATRLFDLVRLPAAGKTIGLYPHQLSGGMRQRVMIAMAVSCTPELLIADEPTTALDVTIQAQIMRLLADLRRELGSALLLITHDLGLVAGYCDWVNVMYAGQIVESAPTRALFAEPVHPYTQGLLRASLSVSRPTREFLSIDGQPPELSRIPSGCRFHPRCTQAVAACRQQVPTLHRIDAHQAATDTDTGAGSHVMGGRVHRCDEAAIAIPVTT